ncbi:MAG: phosphatidate cytidylyltransferase [Oscillospiraceae bacterium]|nr:phosphatidate cytidylyltransferase [Oscillospiraceae bacterium]
MKSRLIVSAIGVPILIIVLLFAPAQLFSIILAAMCVVAMHEVLSVTGFVKNRRILVTSMVYAGIIPFWACYGKSYPVLLVLTFAYVVILALFMMASKGEIQFTQVATAFCAAFFIPMFLSALLALMDAREGRFLLFFPFIIAFSSDTGAFFTGKYMGRRKLAPLLSPNKTVEGSIGGIVASVIAMLIYGIIMMLPFGLYVRIGSIIICAVIGAVAGQFGDLVFSCIKRQAGIKDYGNLMPGHGGILDRFDSVIFVTPLVAAIMYFYYPFL